MATNRSSMTFEDFTQSMMYVIDRALEASRQSEHRLMKAFPLPPPEPAIDSGRHSLPWGEAPK